MVSERRSYAAAIVSGNDSGDEDAETQETATRTPVARPSSNTDEFEDPLYVHITENPNLILVSPPLNEYNYASWSRSMQMALEVKNKFGMVDGTVPDPGQSSPKYAMWKRCNSMVCSWILKSISPTIADSIMYFRNAAVMWKMLRKRYSQADPHRIAELQNEIFKNTQGNMTVNEYFTKCNALWEQLNAMRPIPMCECVPSCSCSLMDKIQKEREDDQIIRFLEGLNEEFETVKSGVLVMDPIPDMEKVFNMTLKLERKIKGSMSQKTTEISQSNAVQNNQSQPTNEQNIVAFSASNNKKRFNSNGKIVPKCTYCGMMGHTVDKCYKKHGYPPGWVAGYKTKNRQNGDTQQAPSGSINQVGDIGLSADQFQRLLLAFQNQNQGGQSSNNAAVTLANSGMRTDFKNTSEDSKEGRFISNYHVNAILNSPTTWILDSGALSDHITCSLKYFNT